MKAIVKKNTPRHHAPVVTYKLLKTIRTYMIITLALVINALGWTAFLIPSHIVGGGVAGISALIFFASGLPLGVSLLAINAILLFFGFRIIGRSFSLKTIYSIIVLSALLTFFQYYITKPMITDRFMSAIIGGVLCGLSIGLIFSQGGSTGGTDIIAMIINKYRNISQGKVLLLCDVFIIASSYLVFRSIELIVYGYVTMAVTSYAVDLFITGTRQSVQLFIFSSQSAAIADKIGNEIGRGVTFIKGRGWYTSAEVDIVMVVVRKNESQLVFKTVKEIDPDAFISLANVMGVYGKGFDKIR